MFQVFVASHGHLASGMRSTVELFLHPGDRLHVYDAYCDDGDGTLREELDSFYRELPEGFDVLLLSDIYGGSVNNIMAEYLDKGHTRLVAGINLAFLIEVLSLDELSDERLDSLIGESRAALRRVGLSSGDQVTASQGDDDFF